MEQPARPRAGAGDDRRGAQLPPRHDGGRSSSSKGSWWFEVWQPTRSPRSAEPTTRSDWVLKPGDNWHGFEGLAENHVLVDPIKVTILTPGPVRRRHDAEARHSRGGGDRSSCRRAASRSRRPASIRSWCCSRWASPRASGARSSPSSSTSRISTTPTRRSKRVLPALVEAHPEAYGKMGLKDLCDADPRGLSRRQCAEGAAGHVHRRCPRWRCGRPMPTTGWCTGRSRASRSTT